MLTNDRQLETDKKASKELNEAHTGSGEGFLQDDEALLDEIEGLETLKRTVVGKNRDFTDDSEKEIAVILKVLVENSSEGAVYKGFTALYDQAIVNQVKVRSTLQKGIEKLGKLRRRTFPLVFHDSQCCFHIMPTSEYLLDLITVNACSRSCPQFILLVFHDSHCYSHAMANI
jgi:hypothetical protein